MGKKFAKVILNVILAAGVMTGTAGCAGDTPAQADGRLVQDQASGEEGTGNAAQPGDGAAEPDTQGEGSAAPSAQTQGTAGSEPDVYYMDELYTEEENILALGQSAAVWGVSYQIGKVEYTQSFGDRNRENLKIFTPGVNTDSQGNLSEGFHYLFLTITFTNIMDQTQEIFRTSNSISFIGTSLNTVTVTADACYYDVDWERGTESEKHHWVLEPGESVTSEIGWVIESSDRLLEADDTLEARMGSAGPYELYYHAKNFDGNNEGSYFIDLGVKAE